MGREDIITRVGWDNTGAIAGARTYQGIVKKSADQATSILGSVGSSLKGQLASIGAVAGLGILTKQGLAFNATMDNAAVGIANVVAKFLELDDAAAKNVAAQALEQIRELEPKTAGGLEDLVQGFLATAASAQRAGLTVAQNVDLVAKFANALANASIPAEQLSQELRSIMSGNITSDSAIAKVLDLKNADITKAVEAGTLYETLVQKLGKLGEAGDSAQVAISSLGSAFQQALGAATQPIFEELVGLAKELTTELTKPELKEALSGLGKDAAKLVPIFGAVVKSIAGVPEFLQQGTRFYGNAIESLTSLMADNAERFANGDWFRSFGSQLAFFSEDMRRNAMAQRQEQRYLTMEVQKEAKARKENADAAEEQARALKQARASQEALAKMEKESLEARTKLLTNGQAAIDEAYNKLVEGTESPEDRLFRLGEAQNRNEEAIVAAQKRGDEIVLIELLRRRHELSLQIVQADKASADAKERQLKAENELNKERDARLRAIRDLEGQIKILQLRDAGKNKAADALERKLAIEEKARQIVEATGAAYQKALEIATKLYDLEQKGQKSQEDGQRKRIKGYSQEQESFKRSQNPFRNLDQKKKTDAEDFWKRNQQTPGLDEFRRMQNRNGGWNAPSTDGGYGNMERLKVLIRSGINDRNNPILSNPLESSATTNANKDQAAYNPVQAFERLIAEAVRAADGIEELLG